MATASKTLRNLYEDNQHYNKAFLLYDKLGDRDGTMKQWCESVFRDDILPKFNVNIAEGSELRTLGIGSGTGKTRLCLFSTSVHIMLRL